MELQFQDIGYGKMKLKIERINKLDEVLKCVPFEQEIRNKDRDSGRISDMLMFVNSMLDNPLFGFWIAYDEEEQPIGYTVALISLMPGQKRLIMMRMYAKDKKLKEEFTEILRVWALEFKIRTALMIVDKKRHVRIFERQGWNTVSFNMERKY